MGRKQTQDGRSYRDIHALPGATLKFRDELREARYAAGRDSEGFQEILFAIERLGRACCPTAMSLGHCEEALSVLAKHSPDNCIPSDGRPSFAVLFDLVRDGRNDALHQGAVARNLTRHSIELALILEDALMSEKRMVRDFMVANPICAQGWETISAIRRTMLVNAFSFLPYQHKDTWFFISDVDLVRYLHCGDHKKRLASHLSEAIGHGHMRPSQACSCYEDEAVEEVLNRGLDLPVLVFARNREQLIGLLTPYDVL